jgi:hypothetical protein
MSVSNRKNPTTTISTFFLLLFFLLTLLGPDFIQPTLSQSSPPATYSSSSPIRDYKYLTISDRHLIDFPIDNVQHISIHLTDGSPNFFSIISTNVSIYDRNTLILLKKVTSPILITSDVVNIDIDHLFEDREAITSVFLMWEFELNWTGPKPPTDLLSLTTATHYKTQRGLIEVRRCTVLDVLNDEMMKAGINHLTISEMSTKIDEYWSFQAILALPDSWKPNIDKKRGEIVGSIVLELVGPFSFSSLSQNLSLQFCLLNGQRIPLDPTSLSSSQELTLKPQGNAITLLDNRIDPYFTLLCPNVVLRPFTPTSRIKPVLSSSEEPMEMRTQSFAQKSTNYSKNSPFRPLQSTPYPELTNLPPIAQVVGMTFRYYKPTTGRQKLSILNTHYLTSPVSLHTPPVPQFQPRFLWQEHGLLFFRGHFEYSNDTLNAFRDANNELQPEDSITLYLIFPNSTNSALEEQIGDNQARIIALPRESDDNNGVADERYYYGNVLQTVLHSCNKPHYDPDDPNVMIDPVDDPKCALTRADLNKPSFKYFVWELNAKNDLYTHNPTHSESLSQNDDGGNHNNNNNNNNRRKVLDYGHILSSLAIDFTQRWIDETHGTPYILARCINNGITAWWLTKQPYKTPKLSDGWISPKEESDRLSNGLLLRLYHWNLPKTHIGSLGVRLWRQLSVFQWRQSLNETAKSRPICAISELKNDGNQWIAHHLAYISPMLHLDTYPSIVLPHSNDGVSYNYYQYISFPMLEVIELEESLSYQLYCPTVNVVMNSLIHTSDTSDVDYLQLTYETKDEFVQAIPVKIRENGYFGADFEDGFDQNEIQNDQTDEKSQFFENIPTKKMSPLTTPQPSPTIPKQPFTPATTPVFENWAYQYIYDIFNPEDDNTQPPPQKWLARRPRQVILRQNAQNTLIVDFEPQPYVKPEEKSFSQSFVLKLWHLLIIVIFSTIFLALMVIFLWKKCKKVVQNQFQNYRVWRERRAREELKVRQDELLLEQMKVIGEKLHRTQVGSASGKHSSNAMMTSQIQQQQQLQQLQQLQKQQIQLEQLQRQQMQLQQLQQIQLSQQQNYHSNNLNNFDVNFNSLNNLDSANNLNNFDHNFNSSSSSGQYSIASDTYDEQREYYDVGTNMGATSRLNTTMRGEFNSHKKIKAEKHDYLVQNFKNSEKFNDDSCHNFGE